MEPTIFYEKKTVDVVYFDNVALLNKRWAATQFRRENICLISTSITAKLKGAYNVVFSVGFGEEQKVSTLILMKK